MTNWYLIFSISSITLLIVAIIITSVYASSFQRSPNGTCPEPKACPECPAHSPYEMANMVSERCTYNFLNFPFTRHFYLLTSAYGDTSYVGGYIKQSNEQIEDLVGLKIIMPNNGNWNKFEFKLDNNNFKYYDPNLKLYVFTQNPEPITSIGLFFSLPAQGWEEVEQVKLVNGTCQITTKTQKIYTLISLKSSDKAIMVAGISSEKINSKTIIDGKILFPFLKSPFSLSQFVLTKNVSIQ